MKTYTIKPLEWVERCVDSEREIYHCKTLLGTYLVMRARGFNLGENKMQWSRWRLIWEESWGKDCDSLQHGKALAEADWQARILPALEEVVS